ncbi:MAG: histidine kinase [Lacunisphaera sp.]
MTDGSEEAEDLCLVVTSPARPPRPGPGSMLAELWEKDDFLSHFQSLTARCLAGEEVHDEARFELAQFGSRSLELNFYPHPAVGEPQAIVVVRDVTPRKRAAAQLQVVLEVVHLLGASRRISPPPRVRSCACSAPSPHWPVGEVWRFQPDGTIKLFSAVHRPDFADGPQFHREVAGLVLPVSPGQQAGHRRRRPGIRHRPHRRPPAFSRAKAAAPGRTQLRLSYSPASWRRDSGASHFLPARPRGAQRALDEARLRPRGRTRRRLPAPAHAGTPGDLLRAFARPPLRGGQRRTPEARQTRRGRTCSATHPTICSAGRWRNSSIRTTARASANAWPRLRRARKLTAFEARCVTRDGAERCILWNATPQPAQHLVIATGRDITHRKLSETAVLRSEEHYRDLFHQAHQMQENLRRMSDRVLKVQEHERHRISRDLHDEVGQALTAINMNLSMLRTSVGSTTAETARRFSDTQSLIEQTMANIHNFSRASCGRRCWTTWACCRRCAIT